MFAENYLQRRDPALQYYQQSAKLYEYKKAEELKRSGDEKQKIQSIFNKKIGEIEEEFQRAKQIQNRALSTIERTKWSGHQHNGFPTLLTLPSFRSIKQDIKYLEGQALSEERDLNRFIGNNASLSDVWGKWLGISGVIGLIILVILGLAYSLWGAGLLITLIVVAVVTTTAGLIQGRQVGNAYQSIVQLVKEAEKVRDHWAAGPRQLFQQSMQDADKRHATAMQEIENQWIIARNTLQPHFRALNAAFQQETEYDYLGAEWKSERWSEWMPSSISEPLVRIGTLIPPQKNLMSIPAVINAPGHQNILFEAAGDAKARAMAAMRSIIFRMLLTHQPGKVWFTFLDPVGLGQNVAQFMQLADEEYYAKLVDSRAWTEPKHIEQALMKLTEHMEDVIQKYLRGQYHTIEEYNKDAGEVREPYRVLVVMGFPVNFAEDTVRRLISIATNGPKCGVSVLLMRDTEQPLPYGCNIDDLTRASTVIAWESDGQKFIWQEPLVKSIYLQLDMPPEKPTGIASKDDPFNKRLLEVGERARIDSEVKVPFQRVAPASQQDWWSGNTKQGLRVAIGRVGATRLQYLDLGKGTAHHVLVAGKIGAGKTNLLHVLIANLVLTYSPSELELYLIDFKTVGFTPYATYALPHARVVATQSEREFGLSVLRGLDKELERRKQLFSSIGVENIAAFRDMKPDTHMPRTLLLIDEFQELFTYDDKIAQEAGLLLDRLVRQGRAFGMHVLLGSQTLAGTYTLARSTISQIEVRIAFQCSEADSRLILSDENPAARLLFRPGEAIYNATNGLVEGNMPFQTALLPEEELDQLLQSLRSFANQPQVHHLLPTWEQRIFRGDANAEIEKSMEMRTLLFTPYREVANGGATLLLGEPTELKSATSVQIRHQAGNNMLLVGQRDEESLAVMHTILLGLVAQHQPRTLKICVLDLSSTDSPGAGQLEKAARLFPHSIQFINRRSLPTMIATVSEEVTRRLNTEEQGRSTIYLLIYGLQRARDLRHNDDYSSYTTYGNDDAASANSAKQFATILRDGPESGVHTIAWCDSLANINRTLERGTLREFELRVLFQMAADDSRELCDSQAAAMLGTHRALLYNEETGHVEKFRPFGLPSDTWMQHIVGSAINQKNNVRA